MSDLIEKLKVTGLVTLSQYRDNQLIATYEVPNIIVTSGLQHIASCMTSVAANNPVRMTHMALGNSSVTPSLGQTSLGGELGRVGLGGGAGSASGNTITYTAMFGAGVATGAVVEAGIFNNVTLGVMLCRTTFPVINKGDSDSLAVTWLITIQ
jgi:hypothetical protein